MNIKKILSELKQGLIKLYGDRLVDVLLYGSYARGEQRSDSDIDVAVILKENVNSFKEIDRITEFSYDISLKYSVLLSIHPISEFDYITKGSPFLLNLRAEGISF